MALEFAVLDEADAPMGSVVELGAALHHALLQAAETNGISGFERFADYYQDAIVQVDELSEFESQLRILADHQISPTLRRFVLQLKELVAFARNAQRQLIAIAD